jgi:tetratricopeptide (TPR) repeat protein
MDPTHVRSLDHRRKQRIVEIVNDLLRAAVIQKEIEEFYRKGALTFTHVETLIDDKGHSILYRLKANCHALFRNSDPPCHDEERLLDLAVGSIFHEAMKLRENLYQVETYRPRYLGLRRGTLSDRKSLLDRFEKIVLRAEQGVQEGVADIRALFQDTLDQLVDLIRGYGQNDLLIRFLLANRKLFVTVYGKKRLEGLFNGMFKKGLIQAHRVGANSYLQSGSYDMAFKLFAKTLSFVPEDGKVKFLYTYAKGMHAYYNNNYENALRFFAKLPRFGQVFKGRRTYVNQAAGVCQAIASESLAEQRKRLSRRAGRMAQELQITRDSDQSRTFPKK